MKDAEFDADFVGELKEILLSTSTAEIYGPPGTPPERVEEPFLSGWHMRSIAFGPGLGRSRVICRLYAGGKEVTATIDADDFPEVRAKRTRSRAWNNSQYHDAAVLVSVLIQEQILTRSPDDLDAGQVRICLPADRSQN
jgi:hypothetical protein